MTLFPSIVLRYSFCWIGKDSFVKDSGKLVELDKILEKEKLNNSRVLIFSHMSSMLRILEVNFYMSFGKVKF